MILTDRTDEAAVIETKKLHKFDLDFGLMMRSSFTLVLAVAFSPSAMCFAPVPTENCFQIDTSRGQHTLNLSSPWGTNPPNNSNQPPYGSNYDPMNNQNPSQANSEPQPEDEEGSLKGNRFSKFAPDTNLSSDDFRQQLKENMKADLERRRREDPNRGNQPAKSYLDSL